jgi:hypothetical protein
VQGVLERSTAVPRSARVALGQARRRLSEGGPPVEAYRRLSLDDALALL